MKIRILLCQPPEQRRQQKKLGVSMAAHRKHADGVLSRMFKSLFGPDGDVHHPPGIVQEGKPLPGDTHDAGGAVKQRHTQFLFQRVDLLGDGGLGDVQQLRRSGKVERLRNGQKTG